MSKQIIRVIQTRVLEYSPFDENRSGQLEDWYQEKGVTTIAEAMELDRQAAETKDPNAHINVEEYATVKVNQTTYSFNIVTVPDNYDPTSPED